MSSSGHYGTLNQFQYNVVRPISSDTTIHQQWPWRGLAFCSDLGTLGYLVNRPKMGILGWVLALPYYLYAVFKQPKGQQRRQEFLYQSTANGIFPLLEAKAGVGLGGFLHQNIIQKYPTPALSWLTQSRSRIAGGLTALLALTPTLGDPISQWILGKYKTDLREGQAR